MAVALLRGVAALDAKACLEWGYPKEGKWQHDDDGCAGSRRRGRGRTATSRAVWKSAFIYGARWC